MGSNRLAAGEVNRRKSSSDFTMRGTIKSRNGEPVSGARVTLQRIRFNSEQRTWKWDEENIDTTLAAADGTFSFDLGQQIVEDNYRWYRLHATNDGHSRAIVKRHSRCTRGNVAPYREYDVRWAAR